MDKPEQEWLPATKDSYYFVSYDGRVLSVRDNAFLPVDPKGYASIVVDGKAKRLSVRQLARRLFGQFPEYWTRVCPRTDLWFSFEVSGCPRGEAHAA